MAVGVTETSGRKFLGKGKGLGIGIRRFWIALNEFFLLLMSMGWLGFLL
jgi:hypothetical protein